MTRLYKYQRQGVKQLRRFLNRTGGALLADQMGLGKSIQVLGVANEDELFPFLAICPGYLKWHWGREAKLHFGLRSVVLCGQTPPSRKIKFPDVVVINYEILPFWLDYFFVHKFRPRLIGVDECQYICNPLTERSIATKFICDRADRVIMVSGTPLTNRPIELYNAVHIIRPDLFPRRFDYGQRYCKPTWSPRGIEYKGADNLGELHSILKSECMVRRRKKDVLKDLPPKSISVIPIEIEDRKQYTEARDNFVKWLGKNYDRGRVTRALRNEALVQGGYLKRLIADLKLPGVIKWIEAFLEETDSKLLVFAVHKKIVKALHEHFGKISLRVDGSVTGHKRDLACERFNTNKKTRLLIGNLDAAGQGWSCKSTSYTATVELGWAPGKHEQADDRIHGVGRGVPGQPATCYYLAAHKTAEERLCEILQRKHSNITAILDGEGGGSEFQLFDEFMKILKKEVRGVKAA